MLKRTRSALMAAVLVLPVAAYAGTIPAGTEFQVNTYTSQAQLGSAVCAAPDGSFVVVWNSGSPGTGSSDVFGQRYTSSGARAGSEFQVNTYTPSDQYNPEICCNATGDFVVVWQSRYQDGGGSGLFGQRFGSSGAFQGTEFQVNTYTTGTQAPAQICCDAAGDFVVVWVNFSEVGSQSEIVGQRFLSDGAFSGGEFHVNTYTPGYQSYPALCCDVSGDFVVAWQSDGQDGNRSGVFGQRFASSGASRGSEFQINTYTTGQQIGPAICCDKQGDFTVVWENYPDGFNPIGSGGDVFGQRFASGGEPRGTEFQVNVHTTGRQAEFGAGSICCGPNGDFVVAWSSYDQDGDLNGIVARRFGHNGGASSEFQVNTYTSQDQYGARVACDAKGGFVVVWESHGQDGSSSGVFGQRFALLAGIPTPTLSFAGIAAGILALCAAGGAALRRRRRG